MEMTLRWFGTGHDTVTLKQIRQIPGVTGVITTLYDTEPGEVWPAERIRAVKDEVAGAGLHISGIESVNVSENEISAQGYPAFTIADKEAVQLSFYVPGEVRDFLQAGDPVQIEGPAGETAGEVSSIAAAVDPQKGLFEIKADVTSEAASAFLSGSTASLSLVTNAVTDQILIPFDAVYYDNDQAYVFVEEGSKALRRDITAGPYNNEQITVLTGLSGGEHVITTWGAGLKDGAAVEVIEGQ